MTESLQTSAAAPKFAWSALLKTWVREHSALLALTAVLVVIVVITTMRSEVFFTLNNFRNILIQVSVLAVVAAGLTLLMVAGLIDLSVGTMMSLIGVIAALMMRQEFDLPLVLVLPILLAGALGAMNGLLAAYSPSHPFIVTLGVMILFQGIALAITGGLPVSNLYEDFVILARSGPLNLPLPIWIAGAILVLCGLILQFSVFGRHLYALGGNEQAARLTGLRVRAIKIGVYALCGLLVGIAGLMLTARISSGQPLMGIGYELQAIAAVAVGGTPLAGGRGSIVGTLLGVLLLGVISNSLNLLGISGAFQYILQAVVIIVAVMSQRAN